MKTYHLAIVLLVALFLPQHIHGQCVTTYPYIDDFEQGAGNWTTGSLIASPSHSWAWGDPVNKAVLNTAHSGTKCFMTGGLSGAYNANEESYLQSPCFDFTNLNNPYFSFYIRTNVPDTTAGVNVWYSTDNGLTWNILGSENDPGWYNSTDIFAKPGYANAFFPNVPGFSSNPSRGRLGYPTTLWSLMGIPLTSLGGQSRVIFRIYFAGNYNQAGPQFFDGTSIDDIVVSEYPNLSLALTDTLKVCPGMNVQLEAPYHPNFTYLWSTGATTRLIDANVAGNYTCWVSGPGGYTDSGVTTVMHTQPQTTGSLTNFTPGDTVCPGTRVRFFAPGNYVYYTLLYPTGNLINNRYQSGQPQPNLYFSSDSGMHIVYASNGLGCDASFSGNISWYPSPVVDLGPDVSACNPISINVYTPPVLAGVTWQYSFYDSATQQLSFPAATPSVTISSSGFLSAYFIDQNYSCSMDDTVAISIKNLSAAVTSFPEYGQAEGKAKFAGALLPGPYLFDWDSSGVTTTVDSLANLSAGSYYVVVFDANGCLDTVHYTITHETAVFPGDANHDQIANMTDLLPIGLHFGSTGSTRPNASLAWTPQPAPLWNSTQANGRDLRHVDTNGDGVINNADTLAITLNFGQTHNNLRGRNQGPRLHYQMPMGPHQVGDTLTIPVILGDVDTPVVNLYGLVFAMQYDSSLVDSGSVRLDFSNSWFGTKNVNMLSMYRDDYHAQRIDFGMVRTDSMQRNGFGRLFDVIVVVEDHIGKRDLPFSMSFSEVYAIDLKADEIDLSSETASTAISTALDVNLANAIQIFPNPANSHIFIRYQTHLNWSYQLLDQQGKVLSQHNIIGTEGKVMVNEFAAGLYILKIQSAEGMLVRKIIVE